MSLLLRATLVEHVADADPSKKWIGRWLEVVDTHAQSSGSRWELCEPQFRMMCSAIMSDIQTAEGSGAIALKEICRIEAGEIAYIESDGNAWVAYITPDKVWFEGLYSQGEGGEVSFAQYKLAVQTYVRFLADPEHKSIEVEFPS
ncbi:hypothetical protein JNX00_19640 [Hydrogenophaga sp. YM1]|uniref:hypothetical protein n=1 Tax=Hydrogenophaga sp. YM1 TaxID=2806262 RepID=UPI0019581450|nr:hypothetical protein [Hydrogenophaga sp. YM1]QRR33824.1 hypothetical protein JNX00_19640 [Hydrogenophaga sp. YM1]